MKLDRLSFLEVERDDFDRDDARMVGILRSPKVMLWTGLVLGALIGWLLP